MYSNIKDPVTNLNINVRTPEGIAIINNYYKYLGGRKTQSGGKFIGQGSYKCVFKPAIKCLGSKSRYGNRKSGDYISALTTYDDSKTELKMEAIRAKIDPREKFTIKIRKSCSVGELDETNQERTAEFNSCTDPNKGNFLNGKWRPTKIPYLYPYSKYSNKSEDGSQPPDDLVLLISRDGGIDLLQLLEKMSVNAHNIKLIFLNFSNILYGLNKFSEAGYIHSDIYGKNILFDEKTRKYSIIDFGFTKDTMSLYDSYLYLHNTVDIKPANKANYKYWPIDSGISKLYLERQVKDLKTPVPISKGTRSYNEFRSPSLIRALYTKHLDNRKEFIKQSILKLDVYSLGITIQEFLLSKELLQFIKDELRKHPSNKVLVELINKGTDSITTKLEHLVKEMVIIDPIDRISMKDAHKKYMEIMKPLKKLTYNSKRSNNKLGKKTKSKVKKRLKKKLK